MPPSTDDLIAGLVDDLQPVTQLRQARGMALALGALVLGTAGVLILDGPRADLMTGRPDAMLLLSAGLFLVLGLASSWNVIDMARPAVGTRREGWGWTALMAAMFPLAALGAMAVAWLQSRPSGLDSAGFNCMRYGLVWSLATFTALTLWLRRGAPMALARAGLLTGVAAGSAGIFAVSLHCPHNDVVHIGAWHGLTVVLAGLAGRLAVPRLIAW
jgi:hypothetical protein